MANKLTTIIDFETQAAKSKLSDFKSAIGNADSASDKLKAGFGVAKDAIVANAGAIAVGAGAALVAFGVKAVGAFEDTAKAAINLSDSVGITREEASRWIGVADDYRISADTLQSSLGKVAKTIDDTKWKEFGVATRDAGGEVRPVNDILLDTFDKLSAMTNAGDRAREGAKLFGKGYAAIAPLIGHTRDEYVKMLGSVEKGQVITEGEAKSAEAMRLAQDKLHDALQEVTLALGGMIAQGAPVVSTLANIITKALELQDVFKNFPGAETGGDEPFSGFFGSLFDNIGGAVDAFGRMVDQGKDLIKYGPFASEEQQKAQDWADRVKNLVVPSIDDLDRAHKNLADGGMSAVEYQEKQNEIAAADYAAQVDKTSRQVQSDIDAMQHKWDELTGDLDRQQTWIQIQQEVADVKQAFEDAGTAAKEKGPGSPEAIKASQDAQLKVIDLKQSVIDYGKTIDGLPPEKVTDLLAQIDQGNFDATLQEMDRQLLNHTFRINAHLDNVIVDGETHAAGATTIHVGHSGVIQSAEGGIFPAKPGGYLVNVAEGGKDEAVIPLDGKHSIGNGGDQFISISVSTGPFFSATDMYRTGQMIANALAEYNRRN